ncbi:methyltransferase domain-containing protein [Aurantiacibacter spongiae]|uniref:Methyltransferase domain-containing protein n=2 Tax=Aurantiacibacter spongiae TaxID=2488860 RepID=A0A3N5CWC5_9SPHN|nr:methyltransferase domain-containing protein [Aurantiacibacter spongiae]
MLAERRQTTELMDDPALPEATYAKVLSDLARVNRLTLAHRPTLAFLDRAIGQRGAFSLLDVGFGDGDMLRAIAAWAGSRGIRADLTGVDLNPRSEGIARGKTRADLPITYRTGDYADLAGKRFDCIVSSLVAHHMTHDELIAFLRFMDREGRAGWFVNDLHRHGLSYHGYPVLTRLLGFHPIVRADGQTSIARSFRREDWLAFLDDAQIDGARIARYFPFRLCVSKIR